MSFFLYGNGGGIDRVRKSLENPTETYQTLKEVFEAIVNRYSGLLDMEDLSIRYYYYDARINRDMYIILTNRCGEEDYIKKYKSPQFVSFLVNV